jgi:hypothetical protein
MKKSLGTALLALLCSASPMSCDADDRGDDAPRSSTFCNVSEDRECAALPELVEAIGVVRSMGIDPDAQSVEILIAEDDELEAAGLSLDPATALESRDEADADRSAARTAPHGDALITEPDPADPELLKGFNCAWNEYGGCTCCCYWGYGDMWGCGCTAACSD